ncbi:MAG: hypothetical protein GY928_34190 [Colwellia sp.]|nr:hypothetical protein [Colwellia sp.]
MNKKTKEPKVQSCTVRDVVDGNGLKEFHIECRFQDGQKFAPIVVDGQFEGLAIAIANYLNSSQYQEGESPSREDSALGLVKCPKCEYEHCFEMCSLPDIRGRYPNCERCYTPLFSTQGNALVKE